MRRMEKLPISVIIVAKNAERTIEECLEKIRRNDPVEIIIIDGDSTDRTVEIARKFTRRIYSDGGRGWPMPVNWERRWQHSNILPILMLTLS